MANNIEVARAVVTIVPTMEGAQQTITSELTQAASSGLRRPHILIFVIPVFLLGLSPR